MYTIKELAALTGRTVNELHNVRKTVLKDCVVNPGRNPLLYDAKAVAQIDEYYNPPPDWLTRTELQSQIGCGESVLWQLLRRLPKQVKKCYIRNYVQGKLYSPEIVRFIQFEPTIAPIELVAPIPDKDLLTRSELCACLGISGSSITHKTDFGKIPEKFLIRYASGRVQYYRREVLQFILNNFRTWRTDRDYKDGRIDWERLIVMDEYELTPEEHYRRLTLRNMVKGDVPQETFAELLKQCQSSEL